MTGDPTRDRDASSHPFGVPDNKDMDPNEYRDHQRREREAEQKARMDAAHEKAKAERPKLVYCKHMDMDIYEGTCAMCTPPEPESDQ